MGRLTAYIALCLLITAGAALAVQLTWDENDPVPDGYRLYQRTEPGAYDYDNPIWEGIAPPSDDLTGHAYGETYCWVVRAYTGDDVSTDSNEVCLTIGSNDLTTPTQGFAVVWEELTAPPPEPTAGFFDTVWTGSGWMILFDKLDPNDKVRIGYE
jgi:hypothetical protein